MRRHQSTEGRDTDTGDEGEKPCPGCKKEGRRKDKERVRGGKPFMYLIVNGEEAAAGIKGKQRKTKQTRTKKIKKKKELGLYITIAFLFMCR